MLDPDTPSVFCRRIYFIVQNTCSVITWAFRYLAIKVGYTGGPPTEPDFDAHAEARKAFTQIGLESNISLPETSKYSLDILLTTHS